MEKKAIMFSSIFDMFNVVFIFFATNLMFFLHVLLKKFKYAKLSVVLE